MKPARGFFLILVLIFGALLIGVSVFVLGFRNISPKSVITNVLAKPSPSPAIKTYETQEECESATGKSCSILMCDVVPEGKTFEEACGQGFKTGWAPTKLNNSLHPTPTLSTIPSVDPNPFYHYQAISNGKIKAKSNLCGVTLYAEQPSPSGYKWLFQEFESGLPLFKNTVQLLSPRIENETGDNVYWFEIDCEDNSAAWTLDKLYLEYQKESKFTIKGEVTGKTPIVINNLPAYKIFYGTYSDAYITVTKSKRYLIRINAGRDNTSLTENILRSLEFEK